jgi:hypothetical protein
MREREFLCDPTGCCVKVALKETEGKVIDGKEVINVLIMLQPNFTKFSTANLFLATN